MKGIGERISPRSRAILINSPSNPTGNLLSPDRMREIAGLGPWIVSDEIYHGLVYEGKEHTILEYTDHAFVVNGFSKLYAMTGWRLGYLIAPQRFLRTLQTLHQNFFISANSFVQWGAIAALKEADEDVKNMVRIYDERRKFTLESLRGMGLKVGVDPTGAFYVLANARDYTSNSLEFSKAILEETNVAITPGIDFGRNAEGYLRIAYTNSLENIGEGMNRLKKSILQSST